MGNRAVITTAPFDENDVGIYVHWNGGRASIEGFLLAAKELGYRNMTSDRGYGLARLAQAIGLFFGADQDTNIGVGRVDKLDTNNYDNGTYLIGGNWEIVGRMYFDGEEEISAEKTRQIADKIIAITKVAAEAAK